MTRGSSTKFWTEQEKIRVRKELGLIAGVTSTRRTMVDTLMDDFATYGGDQLAQNASAALFWLQLARYESNDGWTEDLSNTISFNTTRKEDLSALRLNHNIATAPSAQYNYATGQDYTADGRFTVNDYVCISIYVAIAGQLSDVTFGFTTLPAGPNNFYASSSAGDFSVATGWNHVKIKRSAFRSTGSPSWADIDRLTVSCDYGGNWNADNTKYVMWDDLRVVKADPGDGTIPNDTGSAWGFTDADDGEWHVYKDMPGFPYALGQIKTASATYVAVRDGNYAIGDHMTAAVLAWEDGKLGIGSSLIDGNNGYLLVLDTSLDTLTLYDRSGGVDTSLGSVSYTAAINTVYYLGLARRDSLVEAYISTTPIVFTGNNKRISVTNTTYVSGRVGLVSYGINARFAHVRAGSPEYALYAEQAALARYVTYPDYLIQQVMD